MKEVSYTVENWRAGIGFHPQRLRFKESKMNEKKKMEENKNITPAVGPGKQT